MLAEGMGGQLRVCLEGREGEREGTGTDEALRSETSNTKSVLLPEYLILNSCHIHFTHINSPLGMWDITLYLALDDQNGIFSCILADSLSAAPEQGHLVRICGVNEWNDLLTFQLACISDDFGLAI